MKNLVSKLGKAAVILSVSGLVAPVSVRAGGPAYHSASSAGASSVHASHPVQTSTSRAYVHPSSSGTSTTKSVTSTATSSIRFTHNGATDSSGGSTTPKSSKINNPSSSQSTITSSNGTIGSTTVGGSLVFKRAPKNPTGASTTLPAGGGHALGTATPVSTNVMDKQGTYSAPSTPDEVFIAMFDGVFGIQPFKGDDGKSPAPGNGQKGGNDPNHLGNGADGNYGSGMAMPVPTSAPAKKIWSGSGNLASSANTNVRGITEKASISLAKGEQVQKHLDQVATANSPAGKLQKGQQIQKQISAGAANSTPSTPNPPSPPAPSTTTNTTPANPGPFSLWPGFGWGYFGGGFAGAAGAGGYDASAMNAEDVPAPVSQTTTPAASQPADGELTLKLGESYTITNENFGTQAGGLSLQLNGLTLAVQVNQWDAEQISFTLPIALVTKSTEGKFQIQGADHQLVRAVPVMVVSADTVR